MREGLVAWWLGADEPGVGCSYKTTCGGFGVELAVSIVGWETGRQ